ncbi:hypothetical protein ACWC2K_19275 [Streptomyces chattanoogensis]
MELGYGLLDRPHLVPVGFNARQSAVIVSSGVARYLTKAADTPRQITGLGHASTTPWPSRLARLSLSLTHSRRRPRRRRPGGKFHVDRAMTTDDYG